MNTYKKNLFTVLFILLISGLMMYILPLIPDYLKDKPGGGGIVGFPPIFLLVFTVFNIVFIGISAGLHKIYSNDYGRIKAIWFFAIFGGVTGGLLGEGGNVVMIIPYTILMLIYAYFYSKFTWWKVALTSYIGGMMIENVMNRSPIQVTTLMWIAFFIYPYFWTKIWENKENISLVRIFKDFGLTVIASAVLAGLAYYLGTATSGQVSPPLIILGATLPFIIIIPYKFYKQFRK